MVKRKACCNCSAFSIQDYEGMSSRVARDWFEDYLRGEGWERLARLWYCPDCARAARLAAGWSPGCPLPGMEAAHGQD